MLLLNGQPVPVTIFPDKTSQVWKIHYLKLNQHTAIVEWKFEHEGEIMHLAQLKMLLQHLRTRVILSLSYLPYGRQDKEVSNQSTFALTTFASIINMMAFEEVLITDPHSERALELIRCSRAFYPVKELEQIAQSLNGDIVLCYPDKGAVTKYTKVYESLYRPHIYGEKVRDQATGNILSYKVVGNCVGKDVLIVDDICDGGATFKLLAKDLLAAGAKSVVLFVTHGIFSKGLQTLKDSGVSRIFCQDGECFEKPGAHWWTEKL